jgi:hypothetical protein
VSEFLEFLAEFPVVVDLAIENDPGSAILIVNRLLSALQIDDRQTAHSQSNCLIEVETVVVRSTVTDSRAHAAKQGLVNV